MLVPLLGLSFLYLCGMMGCIVFKRLRLPLPALLGSLAITAILAIAGFFPAAAPVDMMSTVCTVAIGVMVGRGIRRDSLRMIGQMTGPALVISIWMILLSLASGVVLAYLADIPLSTALIGSAAGGLSEMAIFALSQNYDVATITFIQTLRLVAALAVTPWLARKWSSRLKAKGLFFSDAGNTQGTANAGTRYFSRPGTAGLVVFAATGSIVFQYLAVPAGTMLGALVFSGGMSVICNKIYPFPDWIREAAQIGLGIAIAQRFGPEQIEMLLNIRFLLSVIFSTAFVIAGTLVLSYLLQKMTRWNPLTCLLSSSAGGLVQMVIVAEEMKADPLIIGVLHLARYLAIVSSMPLLITYLL